MREGELEVYLPVCSGCGKALTGRERPVVLLCCHIYCEICVQGLETCRLDQTSTATIVDYTEQVNTLVRSYGTPRFLIELKSLREAINVNNVECPRAFNCQIRPECPYSHTKAIHTFTNYREWRCSGCDVMVENKECPFCHSKRPEKPQLSGCASVDDLGNPIAEKPTRSLLLEWLEILRVLILYVITTVLLRLYEGRKRLDYS